MSDTSFIDALVDDFRFATRRLIGKAAVGLRPDLQPVVTTADRFKRAIRDHAMIVTRDDGLHRHLTFKAPSTYNNHFHITTWPGYLAISGDAGCYVFARLTDMFEFFRGTRINADYWGEKLQAVDRHGGYHQFSAERFHEAVKYDFDNWEFDCKEDEEAEVRAKAWAALQESDMGGDSDPNSIEEAYQRASDYECPVSGNGFPDFWGHDLEDHTFRYLWCCYAIQWAVTRYDAATPKLAEAA